MLSNYPILCDFRSDIIEAKGSLLTLSLELDRRGEIAEAFPSPISELASYIILVGAKYFTQTPKIRQATIIHELGHFYVYRKKLLEQLRVTRDSIDPLFMEFIAPSLKVHEKLPVLQKEWIRKTLFGIYVLDILKIPGEIFANLWVKQNFEEIFIHFLKAQFDEYMAAANGEQRIQGTFCANALIKFCMFSLILRLDGLSILVGDDYGKSQGVMGQLKEFRESCWKTLKKSSHKGEFETFRSFEDIIISASCSIKDSNEVLPNIFKEFVRGVPLRIEDFST